MKNWMKAGVVASILVILVVGMSGCVSSSSTPTTTPTAVPTVKPTVAPTVAPTPDVRDSNIKGIEQNWVSNGYTVVTPFTKTTIDGKVAYVGTIENPSTKLKITAILTSSESEAKSYLNSRLDQYKAAGWSVKTDNGNYRYILAKGSTTMGLAGYGVIYGTGSPGIGIVEDA